MPFSEAPLNPAVFDPPHLRAEYQEQATANSAELPPRPLDADIKGCEEGAP